LASAADRHQRARLGIPELISQTGPIAKIATMKRIDSVAEMKAACREITRAGRSLGFVPTMGALHEGHASLVRASKAQCQATAVSIFVNPLQFAPNEDLAKYPRTLEGDAQMLQALGVDVLFVPTVEEMYPAGATTYVEVGGISDRLDGRSRPGHFRGVATVVAKLFEVVRPNRAFFGQKDAAQVAVLRRMARDLDMDVQLVICPIVREKDGLAMSSRNAYLNAGERQQALVLNRALMRVLYEADRGERDVAKLIAVGESVMAEEPAARLDYFAMVDPDSLAAVSDLSRGALVAVAAFVGTTRLIDNLLLTPR